MMESIIFDILSQNKKVSTLSLKNEYDLSDGDVKEVEKKLFAHENIIVNYLLICEECGAVIGNGVFFKSLRDSENCFVCKKSTKSSSRILIFTKKKLNKND